MRQVTRNLPWLAVSAHAVSLTWISEQGSAIFRTLASEVTSRINLEVLLTGSISLD